MLIAVIPFRHYAQALQYLTFAIQKADAVELRLDYAQQLNFNDILLLRQQCSLPIIFTLRKKSQGGLYLQEESSRLADLLTLAKINPDYIDIEFDVPDDYLKHFITHHPKIKLICSYHDTIHTPTDLMGLYLSLQRPYFYSYKIATHAENTLDALNMLQWVKSVSKNNKITGICMGEHGVCTRILSSVMGNHFHYASLEEATAVGQLTVDELMTTYHFRQLNHATRIYALIGDPIDLSIGHIAHNQAIQLLGQNAVYIKLRAQAEELSMIMEKCRILPFSGFSITMPLKEAILPTLDGVDTSLQAINSIIRDKNKWRGFNTDGMAVMQILSKIVDISKQKIVILGAGGAARAIAHAALQHKANVILLNRSTDKAKKITDDLGCRSDDLKNISRLKEMNYTVLINTLPTNAYLENFFSEKYLLANTIAMDIVYAPMNTPFLQAARLANCLCIPGHEIYTQQALKQIERWFQPTTTQLNKIETQMQALFI